MVSLLGLTRRSISNGSGSPHSLTGASTPRKNFVEKYEDLNSLYYTGGDFMDKKKAIVIGIAGGSGSGKSTICSEIEKNLDGLLVKVIHIDDYYKADKPNVTSPFTGVIYADYNHPNSIDFDRLIRDYTIFAKQEIDVIIIEGLMTLYKDEIRDILDLKIYIDCQADERIVRRIKRNLSWGESFEEITSVYLDAVRYRHNEFVEPSRWHADIILNGSNLSKKGKDLVVKWIRNESDKLN